MANHMAEVAKMLGVELGEWFKIDGLDGNYVFNEDGLYRYICGYLKCNDKLSDLLAGCLTIKPKSWKPSAGDRYWYVSSNGNADYYCWTGDVLDFLTYKLGNCYRTKEEAEANRDKWIEFYSSDEVLEV